MRRWDLLAEHYVSECVDRGVSPEHSQSVVRELDRWGSWMKHRRPKPTLESVDTEMLVSYVQDRGAFRSKATISSIMSTMRGMGEYLVRERIWAKNPLRWMRGPKIDGRARVPKRIGREAMEQLWSTAAKDRQGYHRLLWVTVLSMLYGTGLRRGELLRLDLEQWQREEGLLLIDGRKTGRQRQVPVPETTWRCLEAYLPQRQNHLERLGVADQRALLVGSHGDRLSGAALSGGIRRLGQRSGIERLTLHQFRHTCASDLLAEGLRVPEVQQILGHQTICTTMRYLHVADPERHQAVGLHPINDFLGKGASHEQAQG